MRKHFTQFPRQTNRPPPPFPIPPFHITPLSPDSVMCTGARHLKRDLCEKRFRFSILKLKMKRDELKASVIHTHAQRAAQQMDKLACNHKAIRSRSRQSTTRSHTCTLDLDFIALSEHVEHTCGVYGSSVYYVLGRGKSYTHRVTDWGTAKLQHIVKRAGWVFVFLRMQL